MRKTVIRQWLTIILGLLVFSAGVHLTIFANIGLAPWDCLGMGISYHTPLNYGLSVTALSLLVLGIDLLMREKIGYGTILDAVLTGNFIQMFNDLNPLPKNEDLGSGILIMTIGLAVMAVGMMIYMKGAQGCGPRDSLLLGIGKRMRKIPFGYVEILLLAVVLLIGWLLGGPVGIGTLIGTFGAGIVMQIIYSALKFEPREIIHQSVTETTRLLRESAADR